MRIVYIGSGQFGIPSLDALLRSKHNLELILTQPQRPAGRGRKPTPTAVASWAQQHNIPFIETHDNSSPSLIETLTELKPDLIIVIAFGQKICNELLNLAPHGMINVHGSLLPKYRGAAPINWAIINGETQTGVTIATVTEQWDSGKIIAQVATEIKDDDTADKLHDRLANLAAPLLIETIDKIENGTATYTEQDHSQATRAPKLKKSDGLIDFNAPAAVVRNKIRGLWSWPAASAMYISRKTGKKHRVSFAMAYLAEPAPHPPAPGTIDENLNVACAEGALRIAKIKPAGRAVMDFSDFVNGYGTRPGDLFVKIEQR